jgi:UDP-N-acetylglucosamine 2-epimerase
VATDSLSDLLFASEEAGALNLRAEGVPEENVFFVGNVMIDTLLRQLAISFVALYRFNFNIIKWIGMSALAGLLYQIIF